MTDYYSILGCTPDATYNELKSKYQQLILIHHPDKGNSKQTNEQFHAVREAWKTLCDPERRRQYDLKLKQSVLDGEPLILATVPVSELSYDPDTLTYYYSCRCGGMYTMSSLDLTHVDTYLYCDECSFVLHVRNA